MFQIKQIKKLIKDNTSKHNMQFFYEVFYYEGKTKSKPRWPCVKKCLPLNLITGWATLSSNNCNQAFAITCNESVTALWRNFGPLILAELLWFSHIGGFSSMNRLFKVMPQHLNRIQLRTLTRLLQSLHLVFLQPFRGGFAGVFWIIVLLQNPSSLQLEVTNRGPDIVLQDFLVGNRIHGFIYHSKSSRSWSSKTAPDHHTTTTIFYCRYDVLFLKCCVTFTPDVMGHTPSKKFNFYFILPNVLGIIKMFSGKIETSFVFFLLCSGFCLGIFWDTEFGVFISCHL